MAVGADDVLEDVGRALAQGAVGKEDRSFQGPEKVEEDEWADLPLADFHGYAVPDRR